MSTLFPGIAARTVATPGLDVNVLVRETPSAEATPVVFVHGNVSSALFWQPTMLALAGPSYAIDLRGFGDTEVAPVDASRGLRDFADDVAATLDALEITRAVLVGWSMGGGVVMQTLLDRPDLVAGLALIAPVSPYGFGGTASDGRRLTDDDAGTGAGGANPDFVARLAAKDLTADAPTSPRSVFRAAYVAAGHVDPNEDVWVESMLSTVTGPDNYPGDAAASANWPTFAAGTRGVLNTMAPKYCDLTGIVDIEGKPPVLWIHGDADAIVSDDSYFDLNTLGRVGIIPGWPGDGVAPSQPMISQTRSVLNSYTDKGGVVTELALTGVGHSPHLERPAEVVEALTDLVERAVR